MVILSIVVESTLSTQQLVLMAEHVNSIQRRRLCFPAMSNAGAHSSFEIWATTSTGLLVGCCPRCGVERSVRGSTTTTTHASQAEDRLLLLSPFTFTTTTLLPPYLYPSWPLSEATLSPTPHQSRKAPPGRRTRRSDTRLAPDVASSAPPSTPSAWRASDNRYIHAS